MEEFRWMINEAIRIGMDRNLTSQKTFNSNVYHHLSDNTEFLKMYVARAIQVAKSKINDFRKTRKKNPNSKIPHYKKPYVVVDKQSYKIIGNTLLIGVRPGRPYVGIPLNNHTLLQFSDLYLKTGAITITQDTVSISISKETQSIKPVEFVGIDTNLNNITAVYSDGMVDVFSDAAKITKIKEKYRKVNRILSETMLESEKRFFKNMA